jgi:hypothetical protein
MYYCMSIKFTTCTQHIFLKVSWKGSGEVCVPWSPGQLHQWKQNLLQGHPWSNDRERWKVDPSPPGSGLVVTVTTSPHKTLCGKKHHDARWMRERWASVVKEAKVVRGPRSQRPCKYCELIRCYMIHIFLYLANFTQMNCSRECEELLHW